MTKGGRGESPPARGDLRSNPYPPQSPKKARQRRRSNDRTPLSYQLVTRGKRRPFNYRLQRALCTLIPNKPRFGRLGRPPSIQSHLDHVNPSAGRSPLVQLAHAGDRQRPGNRRLLGSPIHPPALSAKHGFPAPMSRDDLRVFTMWTVNVNRHNSSPSLRPACFPNLPLAKPRRPGISAGEPYGEVLRHVGHRWTQKVADRKSSVLNEPSRPQFT